MDTMKIIFNLIVPNVVSIKLKYCALVFYAAPIMALPFLYETLSQEYY